MTIPDRLTCTDGLKTEIDEFVTHIYETYLKQPKDNVRIQTKHLKALLLDLFIFG